MRDRVHLKAALFTALMALSVLAGFAQRQSAPGSPAANDPKRLVFEMQDAIGMLRGLQQVDSVNRIEYWGTTGTMVQGARTLQLSSFRVSINYNVAGMRVDFTHDGQREVQVVAGNAAWNEETPGGKATPMPSALADRQLQLWLTPIGLAKKAREAGEATKASVEGGAPVLTFPIGSTTVKVRLNKLYEPEQVDAQAGGAALAISYTDYDDLNDVAKADVFLPRRIVQRRGGTTILDLTVATSNTNNPYVIMPVPPNLAKP